MAFYLGEASLLLLFGLIVVGICRMVRHSPPVTERRGFYDTRVAILLLAMDRVARPAGSIAIKNLYISKQISYKTSAAVCASVLRCSGVLPRGGEIFGTQGQVCVRVLHCLRLRNARGTGVVVI